MAGRIVKTSHVILCLIALSEAARRIDVICNVGKDSVLKQFLILSWKFLYNLLMNIDILTKDLYTLKIIITSRTIARKNNAQAWEDSSFGGV